MAAMKCGEGKASRKARNQSDRELRWYLSVPGK
jgi:hypothetical protein